MQADPMFFSPSANTGAGVNKRNRGYPADFEFIERPLIKYYKRLTLYIFSAGSYLNDKNNSILDKNHESNKINERWWLLYRETHVHYFVNVREV